MYKVFCDGTVIYDLFSPDLMLLEPTLKLELNSPGSFEFTIPLDHPYYDLPQEMLSRVWVTKDDEEIFRGRVIEEQIDWYKRKKVYCEGELAFLNDSIQRPAEYHDMTVRDYFKTLIEEHNSQVEEDKQFEIGYVLVEDTNDSLYRYTNYNSTLTEMKEDLVDDLGGCIRVRNQNGHRYLDYINIEDYGVRNQQAIRFGINLLDFTQTMDVSDIATVIIPLGTQLEESPIEALNMRLTIESVNGGSDAIESEEAVKTFGRITKTVIWDDVTLPENLLSKGKKYLSDYQWDDLVLNITPVDLHDSDPDTETFNLGDQLRVISSPHGIDRYFPLSAMTIHLDSLDKNTFTLGTEIKGKTLTGTIQTTINQVSEVENEITPTQILLNQAKEQASNLINAATHGYVVLQPNDAPEEILIMNEPNFEDATKIWRWNLGGLGYGTRAKKTDDFYFETAMTMDGAIVADFITTGTLTANIIKAGTISAVDGNNYWNLDTGDMKVGGWTVGQNSLYNGTKSMTSTTAGTYIGTDGIRQYSGGSYLNITGTEVSNGSGNTKMTLYNGSLSITRNGSALGDFTTTIFSSYPNEYGISLYAHEQCKFIAFGNESLAANKASYIINYGSSHEEYSERHIFYDSARFTGGVKGLSGYALTAEGDIYSTGDIYNASDENIKTNILPMSKSPTFKEDIFDRIEPISYKRKDDNEGKTHFGITYQNVKEAFEIDGVNSEEMAILSTVKDGEGNDIGTISYIELIPMLIYEVQNLKAQVNDLKSKLT